MALTRNNAMIFGAIVISVGVGLKIADCDRDGTSALCIQFIGRQQFHQFNRSLITNYKLANFYTLPFSNNIGPANSNIKLQIVYIRPVYLYKYLSLNFVRSGWLTKI